MVFLFQAEDGIRDHCVTGVQTCALPILTSLRVTIAKAIPPGLRIASAAGIGIFLTFIGLKGAGFIAADPVTLVRLGTIDRRRSEERRVGKERRARGSRWGGRDDVELSGA